MIHQTAIIDESAKIAEGVEIGPYSIIGADVEIGAGTVIGPHVVIKGITKIGQNNRIFQFCSIGEDCQDMKYAGEPTQLIIGDNNVFRESCTVHRGTTQDQALTQIGSHNLFMVNVHVAHDVVIGNHCIVANNTNIAGHVTIDDWAILGGAVQVHQFCNIGAHAMMGGGSMTVQDVPAYVITQGYPAKPHGINSEGLKRRGFDSTQIRLLRKAYKTLYREGLTLSDALDQLSEQATEHEVIAVLVDSIKRSTRGIVR